MAESSNGMHFDDLDIPPAVDETLLKAQANLTSVAGLVWFFFKALVKEGFTRDEALRLVLTWARATVWAPQQGAK